MRENDVRTAREGTPVILHCSYEEIQALARGTQVFLTGDRGDVTVMAPPREVAAVEELARRLGSELSVSSYRELEDIESGLDAVTDALGSEMDAMVVATHAAGEEAISAYFDYANALTVLARARELKGEMRALIELMTGEPVTEMSAREVSFPD